MRALHIVSILLIGLLVTACLPVTTTHPIGTTAAEAPDSRLIGMWSGKAPDNDATSYFTFLPQDDSSLTAIAVTPGATGDKGGWAVFALTTATLNTKHYMNARALFEDNKPATHDDAKRIIPLAYHITEDGRLILTIIDEDAAKAAVKAGRISGTIGKGNTGDVTITAAPKELDAFLATDEGASLFSQKLFELTRMPQD